MPTGDDNSAAALVHQDDVAQAAYFSPKRLEQQRALSPASPRPAGPFGQGFHFSGMSMPPLSEVLGPRAPEEVVQPLSLAAANPRTSLIAFPSALDTPATAAKTTEPKADLEREVRVQIPKEMQQDNDFGRFNGSNIEIYGLGLRGEKGSVEVESIARRAVEFWQNRNLIFPGDTLVSIDYESITTLSRQELIGILRKRPMTMLFHRNLLNHLRKVRNSLSGAPAVSSTATARRALAARSPSSQRQWRELSPTGFTQDVCTQVSEPTDNTRVFSESHEGHTTVCVRNPGALGIEFGPAHGSFANKGYVAVTSIMDVRKAFWDQHNIKVGLVLLSINGEPLPRPAAGSSAWRPKLLDRPLTLTFVKPHDWTPREVPFVNNRIVQGVRPTVGDLVRIKQTSETLDRVHGFIGKELLIVADNFKPDFPYQVAGSNKWLSPDAFDIVETAADETLAHIGAIAEQAEMAARRADELRSEEKSKAEAIRQAALEAEAAIEPLRWELESNLMYQAQTLLAKAEAYQSEHTTRNIRAMAQAEAAAELRQARFEKSREMAKDLANAEVSVLMQQLNFSHKARLAAFSAEGAAWKTKQARIVQEAEDAATVANEKADLALAKQEAARAALQSEAAQTMRRTEDAAQRTQEDMLRRRLDVATRRAEQALRDVREQGNDDLPPGFVPGARDTRSPRRVHYDDAATKIQAYYRGSLSRRSMADEFERQLAGPTDGERRLERAEYAALKEAIDLQAMVGEALELGKAEAARALGRRGFAVQEFDDVLPASHQSLGGHSPHGSPHGTVLVSGGHYARPRSASPSTLGRPRFDCTHNGVVDAVRRAAGVERYHPPEDVDDLMDSAFVGGRQRAVMTAAQASILKFEQDAHRLELEKARADYDALEQRLTTQVKEEVDTAYVELDKAEARWHVEREELVHEGEIKKRIALAEERDEMHRKLIRAEHRVDKEVHELRSVLLLQAEAAVEQERIKAVGRLHNVEVALGAEITAQESEVHHLWYEFDAAERSASLAEREKDLGLETSKRRVELAHQQEESALRQVDDLHKRIRDMNAELASYRDYMAAAQQEVRLAHQTRRIDLRACEAQKQAAAELQALELQEVKATMQTALEAQERRRQLTVLEFNQELQQWLASSKDHYLRAGDQDIQDPVARLAAMARMVGPEGRYHWDQLNAMPYPDEPLVLPGGSHGPPPTGILYERPEPLGLSLSTGEGPRTVTSIAPALTEFWKARGVEPGCFLTHVNNLSIATLSLPDLLIQLSERPVVLKFSAPPSQAALHGGAGGPERDGSPGRAGGPGLGGSPTASFPSIRRYGPGRTTKAPTEFGAKVAPLEPNTPEAKARAQAVLAAKSNGRARPGESVWQYKPPTKTAMQLLGEPDGKSRPTGHTLRPGEVFRVREELDARGTLYMQLHDGRGWAYDHAPNIGLVAVRLEGNAAKHAEQHWRDAAAPGTRHADARSALHRAAEAGDLDSVMKFLRSPHFKLVNHQDTLGKTALHYAAAGGHDEICAAMMRHPEFTARDVKDWLGNTAADLAAELREPKRGLTLAVLRYGPGGNRRYAGTDPPNQGERVIRRRP